MDYILWLIVFIFFISIILLIVYLYQKNNRNIAESPVITNFGVTISDTESTSFCTLEAFPINLGTSDTPNFITRNFMVMADGSISKGDTTTGWIIKSLNNTTDTTTVALQNNFTGNFMTWNATETGNMEVYESNSSNPPPFSTGSDNVGWFTLKQNTTVIDPKKGVPDGIVQFQSLTPANRFLTIGPVVASHRNLMVLTAASTTSNNNFRISTAQGKNAPPTT